MPTANLLRHLAVRHALFLVASAVLLAAFQFLICAAVGSVDVSGALEALIHSLPPLMQELVASQLFGGFTPGSLLAFGWNHPVTHALGSAVAIVLAARAVAGESETGAIELLLSQPISRGAYFGTQVGFGLAAIACLSAAGVLGTVFGQSVFGIARFAGGSLLRLALAYALLQGACFGITLLLSVFGREGGRVASGGFLIVLISYFGEAIGRLWNKAAFIQPWTLHEYFPPHDILVRGVGIGRPAAVLGGVLALSLGLAWARFRTRDVP
jgi:ABC-type transport system involved in multi-copper enzyme maturation permease subunit